MKVLQDVAMSREQQPLQRLTLEQRTQLRQRYRAAIPAWRKAIVGYLTAGPFVTIWALCTYFIWDALGLPMSFPSAFLLLPAFFIALLWGVGPALAALALSTTILDFYFLPLPGSFKTDLLSLVQLAPFMLAGLVINLMVGQRERARLQAIATEQELQLYTQHLEEINEKLADANQMKDRFISIASHELKTPVTSIRGQAQLGLRRLSRHPLQSPEAEHLQQTLDRINEQTGHLNMLIDELLDVSSIRTGKIALRKRICDLRRLCQEAIEDQQVLNDRVYRISLPEEPVMVAVDSDRISQVIVNLLSNAVKYSSAPDPIEMTLTQNGKHALLAVRDHGQGIAEDQLEKIFEAFYRTEDAQRSPTNGLGLGLAIVRELVERHGGRIWCESSLEQGSTFKVELPLS